MSLFKNTTDVPANNLDEPLQLLDTATQRAYETLQAHCLNLQRSVTEIELFLSCVCPQKRYGFTLDHSPWCSQFQPDNTFWRDCANCGNTGVDQANPSYDADNNQIFPHCPTCNGLGKIRDKRQ